MVEHISIITLRDGQYVETYPSGSTHGFRHLLVRPQSLNAQTDSLKLCSHLVELLDVASCPDEILGHDFARVLIPASAQMNHDFIFTES